MSAAFNGYLFAAVVPSGTQGSILVTAYDSSGSYAQYSVIPFPSNYISFSTWKSTPNQREEMKAYRDERTRNLTRLTAPGKKSVFSFETRPNLHLSEKSDIQAFFTIRETTDEDKLQRKIQLVFWNDESNVYSVGYFYRPNMEFVIKKIIPGTDPDIIYDKMSFSFVEY